MKQKLQKYRQPVRVAIASLALLALSAPVGAKAMWTFWGYPGASITRYEQVLTIEDTAPTTFWSSQFNFVEQPDSGGYIGVQVDGYAFDLGTGEIAIFSLWNAVRATPAPGAVCGEFGGEGVGMSCRARIQTREGHTYRVSVQRHRHSSRWTEFRGQVWNLTTGEHHPLGTIRVRGDVSLGNPANFIEYFGPARRCANRPSASATFEPPVVLLSGTDRPEPLPATGFSEPACHREVGTTTVAYSRISTGR